MQRNHHRHRPGKLFIVGIGPGSIPDRTSRAEQAIRNSDLIVGYKTYINKISDLISDQSVELSGMRQEVSRAELAVEQASQGKIVSLISSGDAGIYGMAGLALEIVEARKEDFPVEIIPGVTAASAAAALLGAPLMLDFAVISLSDLLVPWGQIRERLSALAALDMVVCLYNPRSKKRTDQIVQAARIFGAHRPGTVPVGICTALGTEEEHVVVTDLDHFLDEEISMQSIVIIGNQKTRRIGPYMVTARGYRV